jgi:hypothetical protein
MHSHQNIYKKWMVIGTLTKRERQKNDEILGRKPVQLPTTLYPTHLEVTWIGLKSKPDLHDRRRAIKTWTMTLLIWCRNSGDPVRALSKPNISYLMSNSRYFGYSLLAGSKAETVKNSIQEEIRNRSKSGNACCPTVQKYFFQFAV